MRYLGKENDKKEKKRARERISQTKVKENIKKEKRKMWRGKENA